jgi:SAM-dependent methyltransferase
MTRHIIEPGSFRDRKSRLFYHDGAVLRGLSPQALEAWEMLSSAKFFSRYTADGYLIPTRRAEDMSQFDSAITGEWAAVLEHKAVPFISYPYEWCFGMLKDAALLQLDLLLAALEENMILKDSSSFNFQWIGAKPVFIDIPSFEKLDEGEPWAGYRQFCQMFLYPLFLQAYKNIPFQNWLRGNIDGIDPEHFSNLMSLRDFLRPGVFMHVYLQAKLQAKYGSTQKDIKGGLRRSGFHNAMIKANATRLQALVRRLNWHRASSKWSDYTRTHSYTDTDFQRKESFVREVVRSKRWNLVWDLGCNVGTFSRIAAENADYVVAMDADHLTIERFYHALKAEGNSSILPLVMNVADPSPNLGWKGAERKALPLRGNPDLLFCLALIHHIVISANIPLSDFVDWLASLGQSLVIELITKEDRMVKTLLRNKEDIYGDYEQVYFERCLSRSYDIKQRERLNSGTRFLYFARKRT